MIHANDPGNGNQFGMAVDAEGALAVIGCPRDPSRSWFGGSAYFFLDNGGWVQRQKVFPSDPDSWDIFGGAVAMEGQDAVIGSPTHDHPLAGEGAAYVFRFDPIRRQWAEEVELLASDSAGQDSFGTALDWDGTALLVGAPRHTHSGLRSGSAYVYRWTGSVWQEEQELLAATRDAGDEFGQDVVVQGALAVVGAPGDDDLGTDSGSVSVFSGTGGQWTEVQKLTARRGAAGDRFGDRVALDGNVILVGAPEVDGKQPSVGAVYLFRFNGTRWVQEQRLRPADLDAGYRFGADVRLEGSLAVIGSPGATADGVTGMGAVYLFRHDGSRWIEVQKRDAGSWPMGPQVGWSVALTETEILAGAPYESSVQGLAGAVIPMARADLALSANRSQASPGDVMEWTTCGGVQGLPNALVVVDVNGSTTFRVAALGAFNANGWHLVQATVPPGLAGTSLRFQSFGYYQPTSVGASESVPLTLL